MGHYDKKKKKKKKKNKNNSVHETRQEQDPIPYWGMG